jgi:hypothetical protein
MLLCGIGSVIAFREPHYGYYSGGLVETFLDRMQSQFPYWHDGRGWLIALGTGVFGIDCFRRLRRVPMEVTRNLWIMAAAFLAIGLASVPSVLLFQPPWASFEVSRGPFYDALWFTQAGVGLSPFIFGLLTVTLAGELSQEVRLRLMPEELEDARALSPLEGARMARHQELIRTVSGPRLPAWCLGGRFFAQLIVVVVLPGATGSILVEIQMQEQELKAPSIVNLRDLPPGRTPWIVSIDDTGLVILNGEVAAEPTDRVCHDLRDRLRLGSASGDDQVILEIVPSVRLERFIDVLNAVSSIGLAPVILEE